MRRASDTRDAERTGAGRRARDRLLTGDDQPLPEAIPQDARPRVSQRMLLLADELRESALAAAGVEAYLVRLHRLLDRDDVSLAELRAVAADDEIERRLGVLDDAIASLRRSLLSVAGG
jgi:hypothetical protein